MPEMIGSKLYNWASILDPATRSQACETAKMDFVYPHMALMPDAHLGKGATVGSVIPTKGAIMPAAVGVDIGCGMMAVQTQWSLADIGDTNRLTELHRSISAAVPLSAGAANQKITHGAEAWIAVLEAREGVKQANEALPSWRFQLGTLGSGNHFIEVSLDETDTVWLFLHSGSRGVGNKLASKHIKAAQEYCKFRNYKLPNQDLAFLEEGTLAFDDYLEALNWAQLFASLNRQEMMTRVCNCISDFMGERVVSQIAINCHHNYTEHVDISPDGSGDFVYLSRKGAIAAYYGKMGLIPGSMGDLSYVVSGKGNAESFCSAPHGAGRNHSRSAAKKLFTREDLDSRMQGVAWGESDAFLDEHPDAYKPIDQVMRDASDLVEVVYELRQIVNVKGN